jgi:S1-C subfamily serine protease
VFAEHQSAKPGAFDHFVEAQLVWDEGMASAAAEYLSANEARRMVILAGSGHLAFGSGIPSRLERRIHASYVIVLNSGVMIEPRIADYILLTNKQPLPPAGALGANLEEKGGECRIRSLAPGGGAEKAGLKTGDVLVDFNGESVKTTGDVRVALWKKKPGERVAVRIRRGRRSGSNGTRDFEVELAAPRDGEAKR